MGLKIIGRLAALWFALAVPALAAENPILDVASVPHLSPRCRALYGQFLVENLPRAFAASNDHCGRAAGGSIEQARATALQLCAKSGGGDCTIYAENLKAEWPGAPLWPSRLVPGPLIQAKSYAFVPDERFIWHGPSEARGVFVWEQGYGGPGTDYRGLQPPTVVRIFNNIGFDVVRFDIDPSQDYAEFARNWLADAVAKLRQEGYRRVIVGGQSRGGFDALWMLRKPGLVDGALILAAGGYGRFLPEFNRAMLEANSPGAQVVVAQFSDDIFESTDLAARAHDLQTILGSRVGRVMVIDRPTGFSGHFSGLSLRFALQFGPCIAKFITEPGIAATCEGSHPQTP